MCALDVRGVGGVGYSGAGVLECCVSGFRGVKYISVVKGISVIEDIKDIEDTKDIKSIQTPNTSEAPRTRKRRTSMMATTSTKYQRTSKRHQRHQSKSDQCHHQRIKGISVQHASKSPKHIKRHKIRQNHQPNHQQIKRH